MPKRPTVILSGKAILLILPKQVIDMRKRLIPKMVQARKDGKRAAFSRMEPYKLFIDSVEVKYCSGKHIFFPLTISVEVDLLTLSPRTH